MTSLVNSTTHAAVSALPYDTRSLAYGGVVVAVLFLLLIEKEIVRAIGRAWGRRSQQGLNVAVTPLLVAFGVIVVVRLGVTVLHRHWG